MGRVMKTGVRAMMASREVTRSTIEHFNRFVAEIGECTGLGGSLASGCHPRSSH